MKNSWVDPDDAPELTLDFARRAQISIGGKVVRGATGTLTKRGRPPVGDEPKQQVTLRLAPRVIRYFKETGEGWQTRLNETLEEYVAAAVVGDVKERSVSVHSLMKSAPLDERGGQSTHKLVRSALTGRVANNQTTRKGLRKKK